MKDKNANETKETVTKDQSKEYTSNYGYYSKLLSKPFDTIDELVAAEKAEIETKNKKLALSEAKKSDAKKVEDAFKAVNLAKKDYEKEVFEARKVCAKIIADAKDAYAKAIDEAQKKLDVAEDTYSKAIKEFTEKHPEGYHMTLRDGDAVTSISHAEFDSTARDFYNTVFDWLFK